MKKYRHSIERIRPAGPPSVDQQFWPVVVAVVVLCSMVAGAVTTLVQGPWMWGSLLMLPAAGAGAILFLFWLDDSLLRRSLQTAILGSFALHLLVLIIASLTSVFGQLIPDQPVRVANQPQKRIVISNRAQSFVFQKPNKHQVSDAKVEAEKQPTKNIDKSAAIIPIEPNPRPTNDQLVRREHAQNNISRLNKEQSEWSRSERDFRPTARPIKQHQPSKLQRQTTMSASATDVEIEKKSPSQSRQNRIEKSARSSDVQSRSELPKMAQAGRRTSRSSEIRTRQNESAARKRDQSTLVPKLATARQDTNRPRKSSQVARSSAERSEKLASVVRISRTTRPNAARIEKSQSTAHSATKTIENRAVKKMTSQLESSITKPLPSSLARRQTVAVPSSQATRLSRNKVVKRNVSQPNPDSQEVAISKSESGKLGVGRSANLDRFKGGQISPVKIASDSSARRQLNRQNQDISMTSMRKATLLARGQSSESSRSLKSQPVVAGKLAGASRTSEKSVQAAAASVDSSAVKSTASSSLEKGASMVDLGSTKIMPEPIVERRGGGGRQVLSQVDGENKASQLNPSGNLASNQAPSPTAAIPSPQATTKSEENDSASPASSDVVDASQGSNIHRRQSDSRQDIAIDFSPRSAPRPSAADSDSSQRSEYEALAARRSTGADEYSEMNADRSDEVFRNGNANVETAHAPRVENKLEFGNRGSNASELSPSVWADDAAINSDLVQRRGGVGTGTLMRSATELAAVSITTLPVLGDLTKAKRNDRQTNQRADDRANIVKREFNSSPKTTDEVGTRPELADRQQDRESEQRQRSAVDGDVAVEIEKSRETSNELERVSRKLEIVAETGPGGLGLESSRRWGKLSDSIRDIESLSAENNMRFRRREFGGIPTVNPVVRRSKEAFRKRNPASLATGGPQTEAAIEAGLEFLASCQLADGSWTLRQFDKEHPLYQNLLSSDTAATGLSLLAFQGAGYNHLEFKYKQQIRRAIYWLVSVQEADGCLYLTADKASNDACRMYSHAIAALAMAEAYGMTQDPEIRRPAQRAIDYITNTQDRRRGGWRYFAEPRLRSSDTSVTGWMMMALTSAELAGLDVPKLANDGIEKWLAVAEDPGLAGQFRYNPYAVSSPERSRSHGRKPSATMTSVGLLMRVYSGWRPDDSRFVAGAKSLLQQLPSEENSTLRDTYYWYYATQVLNHAGGEFWEQWRDVLHPLLVESQIKSGPLRGSWHPYRPVPDRWAPQGGRIYVTAMNLLSLEVKYRLLPLYEKTIK